MNPSKLLLSPKAKAFSSFNPLPSKRVKSESKTKTLCDNFKSGGEQMAGSVFVGNIMRQMKKGFADSLVHFVIVKY